MNIVSIVTLRKAIALVVVFWGIASGYIYASERQSITLNSVALDKDTKANQGSLLIFRRKLYAPGETYARKFVVAPSTIGEKDSGYVKKWKKLFAWGRSCSDSNASEILEKIITNQMSKNESEEVFMRKALQALAPLAQRFELDYCDTASGRMTLELTDACSCCLGRYHMKIADVMKCSATPVPGRPAAFYSSINVTKEIVPDQLNLRKYFFEESDDKVHASVTGSQLRQCVLSVFHEMVHAAWLDNVAARLYQGGENSVYTRHAMELQADVIPLLVLQNDEYFTSAAEFFLISMVTSTTECAILRLKYDSDKENPLQELLEMTAQYIDFELEKSVVAAFSSGHVQKIEAATEQLECLLSKTHPRYYKRLHKVLTAWAAYFIHEKSWEYRESVEYIKDLLNSIVFCWNIPQYYKYRVALVKSVVNEWADNAKATELATFVDTSSRSSSIGSSSSSSLMSSQSASTSSPSSVSMQGNFLMSLKKKRKTPSK